MPFAPAALLFAATTLTTPPPAAAAPFGGAVYLFLGHEGWRGADRLDAPLARAGFSPLSRAPNGGGLGLRFWHDPSGWTGGMELQLASSGSDDAEGRTLSLTAGRFVLQAGRVLAHAGPVRAYAMAGLGFGVNMLAIDPHALPKRADGPLGFADGGKGAESYALALQALFGVDYALRFGGSTRGFDGVLLGLRVGWDAEPLAGGWGTEDAPGSSRAVDLPRVTSDGPFVHFVVGDTVSAN